MRFDSPLLALGGWVSFWLHATGLTCAAAAEQADPSEQQAPLRERRALGGRRLPPGVDMHRDLEFGRANGRAMLLDLYLPAKSNGPLPLIIWIHGGAWRMGSKDGGSPGLGFTTNGYAMASISYRLSQEAIFPAQIHDCKAAVRWLRANAGRYHLDPARFAAWGPSAGGHLAALLGTSDGVAELEGTVNDLKESSRVQAVVDWFGPTDLVQMNRGGSTMDHDAPNSPESQLIGGPIQANREKAAKANPVTYVSSDDPPFLIMHGDQDRTVPFNQSELLYGALKKAGVEATFLPVKGAGHGFREPDQLQQVRAFLDWVLRSSPPMTSTR